MDLLVKEKSLSRLLGLLIFLTIDLMILGAAVRAMDAGLACPDWPLCFGKVVPAFHVGVYFEFIHRAIAGGVALLYLFLFIKILRNPEFSFLRFPAFIGGLLLLSQVVMGALTVLKLLSFWTVTLHLMLATCFLATLLYLRHQFRKIFEMQPSVIGVGRLSFFTGFTLLAVFVQMLLGGLVASTYSGLICVDFPTCNGQYFPVMEGPIALQMLHRWGAYSLLLLITTLFFKTRQAYKSHSILRSQYTPVMLAFALVFCQLLVGIMNLKFFLPAWLTVIHSALAILIFTQIFKAYLESVRFGSQGSDFEMTVHRQF